jgi:RimJ/RimL family protein N-acetyltransferase
MPVFLEECFAGRMPLRYGTDACCLVLSDSRYTREIVALRNDPAVNQFIHNRPLIEVEHEAWLMSQTQRIDTLNFVALINGRFGGTSSLYDIVPQQKCQYGRVVMPGDERRVFAIAVEFLCLSFAFEILGTQQVYCRVIKENHSVYEFHARNGWRHDSRYDEQQKVNGRLIAQYGMSMDRIDWARALEKARPMLQRLHRDRLQVTANYGND